MATPVASMAMVAMVWTSSQRIQRDIVVCTSQTKCLRGRRVVLLILQKQQVFGGLVQGGMDHSRAFDIRFMSLHVAVSIEIQEERW